MVLDLPATFLVNSLVATRNGLVADDVDLVAVGADEFLQNATNDGRHAGGDDDGGDVVGQRPLEVLVEVRVEGDVLDEVVDALGEGAGDGVHHLAESVSVLVGSVSAVTLVVNCFQRKDMIYLKVFLPSRTSLLPCLRFSAP